MQIQEARRILHVEQDADPEEIKSAYRKLALELHPDKNIKKDEDSFKRITIAYNILKNESPSKPRKTIHRTKPQGSTYNWGASKGAPPEEDWSKFTREFEEGDPTFWRNYEEKFWRDYDVYKKTDRQHKEEEKAQEPNRQPNLKIITNESLCIGCCSCEIIAPNVFAIDESRINPKSHVINQKGAGFNKIMNAAETCPTKAISVDDLDTNTRLWPL